MRFGIHVPNFGPFADPVLIGELAAATEASGWDGYFLWDHIARYEGVFPMCEPWAGLTVAATATERVLLGLLVTPLPRRRPWIVARQVATLDHLSGGRMVFGVGIGVSGTEFDDFGEVPDPRIRGDMLDEGLAIVRAAWTGEPVTHHGAHFRVDGVTLLPPPVQPQVPIWGATERVRGRPVRRAATLDGVFPFGLSPEQGRELLDVISELRPGGLEDYDLIAAGEDGWEAWRDAGATWWLQVLPWSGSAAEARAIIDAGPPS
jgi:alkanesulfonate monooxygenase SsuD/methylene tetrahydromethanopterin reductase-like flavin-dependent oxidoreductase (luciferase family)